jgi:hypothetical protein
LFYEEQKTPSRWKLVLCVYGYSYDDLGWQMTIKNVHNEAQITALLT